MLAASGLAVDEPAAGALVGVVFTVSKPVETVLARCRSSAAALTVFESDTVVLAAGAFAAPGFALVVRSPCVFGTAVLTLFDATVGELGISCKFCNGLARVKP